MQRAIPSTGETLPVIGLGRGNDTVDPAAFRAVLKAFVDNGGRVLDTVHDTEGMGEQLAATAATQLGIQNRIFWSLRGTGPGGLEALKARNEEKQLQTELINCVGQLACSFMHCIPDALCPPDACETETPVDCLPCGYAVEVLQ